jgi:formylglycine-generating enzyme
MLATLLLLRAQTLKRNPLMSRISSLILLCASVFVALQSASAVTIQWSPVGNPGNAADPADGDIGTPGVQHFGAVSYAYKIGTYDVTNAQYVEFLNAKASAADPYGLWNSNMSNMYPGIIEGGISRTGSGPDSYNVKPGFANKPVYYVTWYEAFRFANWLNNGQGNGDTETGAYTLLGGTPTPSNGLSITRNAGATICLSSENEWYKAAYFNPVTSSYFLYPTSSNAAPTAEPPPGGGNSANFILTLGGGGGPGNATDVGAYSGTTSPYGAFDMGGNVFQWNEASIGGSFRGVRGGSWNSLASTLPSSFRNLFLGPTFEDSYVGFRVANNVPEPSSGVLAVIACGMMWWWGRKRFK